MDARGSNAGDGGVWEARNCRDPGDSGGTSKGGDTGGKTSAEDGTGAGKGWCAGIEEDAEWGS